MPSIKWFIDRLVQVKTTEELYHFSKDEALSFNEACKGLVPFKKWAYLVAVIQYYAGKPFIIDLSGITGTDWKEVCESYYLPLDEQGNYEREIFSDIYFDEFYDRICKLNTEENIKTTKNVQKKVDSYAEIANKKKDLSESIASEIRFAKSEEIGDGKLSEKEITALSETIMRVPEETWNQHKKIILQKPKDQIYYWAIANANFAFPYLKLKDAAEHVESSSRPTLNWGWKEGKVHLPPVEIISIDSNIWGLIVYILQARIGKENVLFDAVEVDNFPDLSNEVIAKEKALSIVLQRIIELFVNPGSMTIRKGKMELEQTNVRNAVDGYVLDKIYRDNEDYKNLTLSGMTLSQIRRIKKVTKNLPGSSKKTVNIDTYVGYKLAEILVRYSPERPKEAENDAFVRLIFGLLDYLVENHVPKDFVIPKNFFQTASEQVRLSVRRGPKIKTKEGKEKVNMYIPFSFAKSAECGSYPEHIKKSLTELGSAVVQHIDTVNTMSVKDANVMVPVLKSYIESAYLFSDTMRREWRKNARIPKIAPIKKQIDEDFEKFLDKDGKLIVEKSKLQEYIDNLRTNSGKVEFEVVDNDSTKVKEILAKINEIEEKRKADRGKTRR